MLVELQKDSAGLSNALWYAETGIQNINRVLDVAEDFHREDLEYDVYVDSLASIAGHLVSRTETGENRGLWSGEWLGQRCRHHGGKVFDNTRTLSGDEQLPFTRHALWRCNR